MNLELSDMEYICAGLGKDVQLLRDSKILITGGTGFIGKWFLESFFFLNNSFNLNASLSILSRDPEKFLTNFPAFRNKDCFKWVKGDIRNFNLQEYDFTHIIHAATDADALLNIENPMLMLEIITEGTKRILEFSKEQSDLKSFLFLSSGAIYGKQPENQSGLSENDGFYININDPGSAYAEGKRLAELYCSIYAKQYNLQIKIARCFAFVGPYLPIDKHFVIGNFIKDGLNGQNITIIGDGSPLRSYMYASDLILWLWMLMLKSNCSSVYNIGSGESISIKELAKVITGFFPDTKVNILNQVRAIDRNQNYVPDVTKFKEDFKPNQIIDLENAVKKTISFYQKK